MAFGLPIIGSDFGHIKKYIERDNCGLVVDPSSSDKIALAMIELLTDQKKYQMFSNNGRKATLKKYKWEKEFKKLLQYYSNALDERDKDK
jgi:glycosyltransferase involved in cell wall biosynthesis